MNTFRFIARNPADALAQVHAQLGPDAVVLNVQPLPVSGVARLWQRDGKIEVTAGLPDKTSSLQAIGVQALAYSDSTLKRELPPAGAPIHRWRSVAWLETMGLLPVHGEQLQAHLNMVHGDAPPDSLDEEWALIGSALSHFWKEAPPLEDGQPARPHVFIGPPGSGKTTALCKWLTWSVLTEERAARVWRLDGNTANTSEWLAVHCEMLGVPLERFWSKDLRFTNDNLRATNLSAGAAQIENRKSAIVNPLWLVDLPGVEGSDPVGLAALQGQLALLPSPRVHLVLNAAYETSALFEQWRVFRAFAPEDLIFTHLDEENQRVKLWNFVFGTNCSLRFLAAGQKIPGEFRKAAPEFLVPAKIR